MKKRIRQNIWGNWNGYIGRKKVVEFGTDEIRARHWFWLPINPKAPIDDHASALVRIAELVQQRDELRDAVKAMMHDLDIFYGKYRDKDNKYIANLKAAVAKAERN